MVITKLTHWGGIAIKDITRCNSRSRTLTRRPAHSESATAMEHGRGRQATMLLRGEGSQVELSGQLIVRKAGGLTSGGTCLLEEMTFAPYCYSVMPYTSEITRVFYVVEGMLAFTIGEETITVTRGAIVMVPRGLAHASFNPAAAPATCLVVSVDGILA